MYLTQEDVVAVSCSPNAANTILRQLDMELISLKRQVFFNKNNTFNDSVHFYLLISTWWGAFVHGFFLIIQVNPFIANESLAKLPLPVEWGVVTKLLL